MFLDISTRKAKAFNRFGYLLLNSLLPISVFVLDEKFHRNASKFAIFHIYENPKMLFPFFISCYFIFFPNECHGLWRHRPGHLLGENAKYHEMKNRKSNIGFSYIWNMANFEVFCQVISSLINLLFLKSEVLTFSIEITVPKWSG